MARDSLQEETQEAGARSPHGLNRFLHSIADAGLEFLRATSRRRRSSAGTPIQLCRDLLSTAGEASGTAIARDIVALYRRMDEAAKLHFFKDLEGRFDVDPEKVIAAADAYRQARDLTTLLALNAAVEPPRQELLRRINTAPDGAAVIVAMRRDLLRLLPQHAELRAVDADLQHLLSSWFNRGFLTVGRIDWNAPAAILENLIRYESVHAIDGWDDLRRRLAEDRRCFAFFHPALPGSPIIFVEVALVQGMASAIQPLLDRAAAVLNPRAADTAIFFSINNCHEGLKGISFGNFLIKQVVLEIAQEFPAIKTFATLSPIPGFRAWLAEEGGPASRDLLEPEERKALDRVEENGWADGAEKAELRPLLLRLCAYYLLKAKRNKLPVDPVARFHLRNGAYLGRINWLADRSPKGIDESAGLMANYIYDHEAIEKNHEEYVAHYHVVAAPEVVRLLPRGHR